MPRRLDKVVSVAASTIDLSSGANPMYAWWSDRRSSTLGEETRRPGFGAPLALCLVLASAAPGWGQPAAATAQGTSMPDSVRALRQATSKGAYGTAPINVLVSEALRTRDSTRHSMYLEGRKGVRLTY